MIKRIASSGLNSRYCGSRNKGRSAHENTEALNAPSFSSRKYWVDN